MKYHIINKDNIIALKDYPNNYFDSVVTDPPYGLGREPDAVKLMKDWVEKGYHEIKGTGFMGKEWDAFVPQPLFWKEVFRVLKPGGHCLAFYSTRTYDWGVMAMRFAGFEIRDCIQWLYGSGFPKSHNIGKAIDKIECNSQWDGWGSALKPANEPIVLARKPLKKGLSIAENVLKWGVGGINIDGCRIKHNEPIKLMKKQEGGNKIYGQSGRYEDTTELKEEGRFPANIILTHHPECECKGLKRVKGSSCKPEDIGKGRDGYITNLFYGHKQSKVTISHTNSEGMEEVEDWNCHPDCPIKILDEQSGISKSNKREKISNTISKPNINFGGGIKNIDNEYNDKGGASRFFYVAKASKSERNRGLEQFDEKFSASAEFRPNHMEKAIEGESGNPYGRWSPIKNFHPTVKPVKLMQYLVRLITPPNGIVLDPFCGSGTTGIACKLEGFNFIGIEQDTEYCKIAKARIKSTKQDINLFNCV